MAKKRHSGRTAAPPVRPADNEYLSTARSIEEGVLIARSTLIMAVKNDIIVGLLRGGRILVELDVESVVRRELDVLAAEQRAYAARTETDATVATTATGALRDQHDYRPADFVLLRQRARIYSGLAEQLSGLRDDPGFVTEASETARQAAWSELSAVIEARLDRLTESPSDPEYTASRASRMRALREIDLKALEPDYSRWQTD